MKLTTSSGSRRFFACLRLRLQYRPKRRGATAKLYMVAITPIPLVECSRTAKFVPVIPSIAVSLFVYSTQRPFPIRHLAK